MGPRGASRRPAAARARLEATPADPQSVAPSLPRTVAARLGLLAEKGYSECFAWSIHAVDKATRWDDEVCGDLQRFAAEK